MQRSAKWRAPEETPVARSRAGNNRPNPEELASWLRAPAVAAAAASSTTGLNGAASPPPPPDLIFVRT